MQAFILIITLLNLAGLLLVLSAVGNTRTSLSTNMDALANLSADLTNRLKTDAEWNHAYEVSLLEELLGPDKLQQLSNHAFDHERRIVDCGAV